MADLPTHPEAADVPDVSAGRSASWLGYVVVGVVAVLFLVVIALHLTGTMGAGAH